MYKAIYKPLRSPEYPIYFQQAFIYYDEPIPDGWTDDIDNIKEPDWENKDE